MSRVGKLPVKIPEKVKVEVKDRDIRVVGPKGEMLLKLPKELSVEVKDSNLTVSNQKITKSTKALHGTYRALIRNTIKGVSEGWTKKLELVGTGYRVELKGNDLVLAVGFSHPVEIKAPEGIEFKVEKSLIAIEGVDKESVGQIAATIRAVRPPEPYKGKGIKYEDEVVKRKPGKAAKAQGVGTA